MDKTEIPEPAFDFLVVVLFSDLPTARCLGKSQAGFTKHFPQTWHHISPMTLVPAAQLWTTLPFLPAMVGAYVQGSGIK